MSERKNEARWMGKYRRWQINVQRDGRRKTFYSSTPGTKGKITAEKQADRWLKEGYNSVAMRFTKLYEAFLAEKELLKGKSSSDLRKHDCIGRLYLLPRLGTKKTENITLGDWQSCINDAYKKSQDSGRPLSAKSLKNIRASMTAVYAYAVRRGIPLAKPEYLQLPKSAPVGERKILTPEDIQKIFDDTIKPFWYIHYVRFLLLTGLRPGEALGIRPAEDIADSVLVISRSVNNEGELTDGKNASAHRSQYLSPMAQQVIADQRQMLKTAGIVSPWLFPGISGDMATQKAVYPRWRAWRDTNGITPCTLYELRHTMVSITKNAVPTHLLKMVLGHTEAMDTYGVYAHEFAGDLQKVADATEGIFQSLISR